MHAHVHIFVYIDVCIYKCVHIHTEIFPLELLAIVTARKIKYVFLVQNKIFGGAVG